MSLRLLQKSKKGNHLIKNIYIYDFPLEIKKTPQKNTFKNILKVFTEK